MNGQLFADPPQVKWVRLKKGKTACGRDPEAGPGTCWWWWEGCPKAKERGCYSLWMKAQTERAHA